MEFWNDVSMTGYFCLFDAEVRNDMRRCVGFFLNSLLQTGGVLIWNSFFSYLCLTAYHDDPAYADADEALIQGGVGGGGRFYSILRGALI